METPPKCEYCGKFISTDPKTLGVEWDGRLVYCGYPVPEPSHDVFWHINCEGKDAQHKEH